MTDALRRAVALHQGGDLAAAEMLYRQVLALQPQSFDAHHLLGVLLAQRGDHDQAHRELDQALTLRPGDPTALSSIGKQRMAAGDFAGARLAYEQALAARPGHSGLLFARGNAWRALGDDKAAEQDYRAAIAADANFADAHNNLGALLEQQGATDEALACFDRATTLAPANSEAWNNRASLLVRLNRFAEAEVSASKAIAARPGFAQAFNSRGIARWRLGRSDAALADFNQALALDPDLTGALANRAKFLWSETGDFALAARDLEQLVRLDPDFAFAPGELFYVRAAADDWRHFDHDVAALTQAVRHGKLAVEPFIFQALATQPADLQANARLYAAREYPAQAPLAPTTAHARGKIRLGYVCGEFRGHATSYLSVGLFERHNRSAFEVIGFDNGKADNSPTRQRLEAGFDRLIPIREMSDTAAARTIREAEIDILINLNGYYGAHRMGVFAARPAPIQVNWLGFPGTLGASYMDYLIADPIVIPAEERDFYDEQIVSLPHSYQVNDNRRLLAPSPPSRAAAGLPDDAFVFCNFNQPYKLSPAQLTAWLRILAQVPDSVLWLWSNTSGFDAHIKEFATRHGIAVERIVIARPAPVQDHLARLALADLILDSLPYNAHTTASDALWAGVPLLTQTGTTFAGRVAASLLQACGLPELITTTPQDYETLAVELAQNPAALKVLRDRLAASKADCLLFDTDLFRRHIEAAYRGMWQRFAQGAAPQAFAVPHR
jgi:protein O-GlcNAc transferase